MVVRGGAGRGRGPYKTCTAQAQLKQRSHLVQAPTVWSGNHAAGGAGVVQLQSVDGHFFFFLRGPEWLLSPH